MMKRDFCAQWLRESASEAGTFHASDLPPMRRSLASEKLRNRKTSSRNEDT